MKTGTVLPPYLLAGLVERYGARPDSHVRTFSRFPLQHCLALARELDNGGEAFEIEIIDVAISGIGFRTRQLVTDGAMLAVEFDAPGLRRQSWQCQVIGLHTFDGTHYRFGAKFHEIRAG
jgi:hypothetical protein